MNKKLKKFHMTRERIKWYMKEIQRLKELDKQTSDRVRATYNI